MNADQEVEMPQWDEEDAGDDLDEEMIALQALATFMEIEGDDELSLAYREALVAIADEALALKERRLAREEAARRRAERARREAEEQAAREARRRQEVRQAQAAQQAAIARAQARAEAERQERARQEELQREAQRRQRTEQPRKAVAPSPVRKVLPSPLPARKDRPVQAARPPVPPAARPAQSPPAPVSHEAVPEPANTVLAGITDVETPRSETEAPAVVQPGGEATERPADPPLLTGADLASWRARQGLTQQAAADRLGVRQSTISKAESRSKMVLGQALLRALAGALSAERNQAQP